MTAQNQTGTSQALSRNASIAVAESPEAIASQSAPRISPAQGMLRLICFFIIFIALAFAMNAVITTGLRSIKTSNFGAENDMMQGRVNAQVIITGSSRASSHYDPRIIQVVTGRTAYNLGRNGTQTDIQVVTLKAYLEHNKKPEVVIHNLDAFSFVTTKQIYDPALYLPYLSDPAFYGPLKRINPDMWKSRYLPLYGYVAEDMNFSWILGVKGFFGRSPHQDLYDGFDPRTKRWTDEFQNYKASNPHGVNFPVEPQGIKDVEDLIQLCRQNNIQLILVYSPEYSEMQAMTNNRAEIFAKFHELASRYNVPLLDYSNWAYSADKDMFQNSQHLNDQGAAVFSNDLAQQLKQMWTPAQTNSVNGEAATSSSKGKN